jgi:hypothetical protein
MKTSNMIDEPGPFSPLETLERHLAAVKALPKTDMTRDQQIRMAQKMVDQNLGALGPTSPATK